MTPKQFVQIVENEEIWYVGFKSAFHAGELRLAVGDALMGMANTIAYALREYGYAPFTHGLTNAVPCADDEIDEIVAALTASFGEVTEDA